ncbi:hypothetical protein BDK51DRAFT_20665, partial [Blyttiomyces helicus]
HSKNNTALAFFTHAEKQKLNYGTQKQRLGRDSMRHYDACFLCLAKARDPQCCTDGHLACKECIFENILAQKKDISRQQKLADSQKQQMIEQSRKDAEIELFEQTQSQFLPSAEALKKASDLGVGKKIIDGKGTSDLILPRRRRVAEPTLTPAAKPDIVVAPKHETICTAEEVPHPITIKKLISVKFTPAQKASEGSMCPACMKNFTNGSKIISMSSLMKTCGHALCLGCTNRFVVSGKKCFVCSTKCKDKDLVKLRGEGNVRCGHMHGYRPGWRGEGAITLHLSNRAMFLLQL